MLYFKNVTKRYDKDALSNISFDIYKNDFLTILGPSGSGKSTILKLINGFETASYGGIIYNDHCLQSLPIHKRNFSTVFQNYCLFPHLTVFENIAFPLRARNQKNVDAEVEEYTNLVKLSDDILNKKPHELSGGQQQRVSIARALIAKPDILLMDEPLGALDKNLRDELQLEIKELHKKLNLTTIYVTHNHNEAYILSNKILLLNEGVKQQLDTPYNLYHKPKNKFVAKFMGDVVELRGVNVRPENIQVFNNHDFSITVNINDSVFVKGQYHLHVEIDGTRFVITHNTPITYKSIKLGWSEMDCITYDA